MKKRGHFINTEYTDAIHSIVGGLNELLKNPYYPYQDQKANTVDYYNIDPDKSTLDQAAKIAYSDLGVNSPIRFNYIKDFFLYGLEQINVSLQTGDYGLESGEISGEATILPNTIQPYPGDYFMITHLKKKYLFKVTNCNIDTLEDGANIWKIEYRLDQTDNKSILRLINNKFRFIPSNIGTRFNPIIREEKYNLAELLDKTSIATKDYFIALYLNDEIQSFSFKYVEQQYMYDAYLIEFLIRNNVLAGSSNYVYICHQLKPYQTFSIEYGKSVFRAFEERDIDILSRCPVRAVADYIDPRVNAGSTFTTSIQMYFLIKYLPQSEIIYSVKPPISIVDLDTIRHIENHEYFKDSNDIYKNILIHHFYNEAITEEEIIALQKISYYSCDDSLFYLLPLLIYCIDSQIKSLFI